MEWKIKCEVCGNEFMSKRPFSKYCSDKCRNASLTARKSKYYQKQKAGRKKITVTKCEKFTCHNFTEKKSNHCAGLHSVYEGKCPFFKTELQYEQEIGKGAK